MSAQCPHCQVHMSRCTCPPNFATAPFDVPSLAYLRSKQRDAPAAMAIALSRVLDDAERAQRGMGVPILTTPTGPARDKLTEINMHLMRAVELLKQSRREGA